MTNHHHKQKNSQDTLCSGLLSFAVINITKKQLKGNVVYLAYWLTPPGHSASPREIRTVTQAETMERQHGLMAPLTACVQSASYISQNPLHGNGITHGVLARLCQSGNYLTGMPMCQSDTGNSSNGDKNN